MADVVITRGGFAVCTTCQYARRQFSRSGCGARGRSPSSINTALKSGPLIGSTTRFTAFTSLRSTGGRRGGGGQRRMTTAISAAATETLRKGIAEFYDESSGVWEDIWGDHMHHGFYEPDADVSLSDHRSAQIRMIEESLRLASLSGAY